MSGRLETDIERSDRDIWLREFRDGEPSALERIYVDYANDGRAKSGCLPGCACV
jgi:hypothetical protein